MVPSNQRHWYSKLQPLSSAGGTGNFVCVCVCTVCFSFHQRCTSDDSFTHFSAAAGKPLTHTHSFFSLSTLSAHLSSHRHTFNTHFRLLTSAQRPISLFEEGCLLTNRTHTLTHTVTEIGFQGPKYREPLLCCHSNVTQTKGRLETRCLQRDAQTLPTCCWPQDDSMRERESDGMEQGTFTQVLYVTSVLRYLSFSYVIPFCCRLEHLEGKHTY